jgi:hypothetical protein
VPLSRGSVITAGDHSLGLANGSGWLMARWGVRAAGIMECVPHTSARTPLLECSVRGKSSQLLPYINNIKRLGYIFVKRPATTSTRTVAIWMNGERSADGAI